MNNIIRELLLLASVREQDEIPVTPLSMDEIITDVLNRMEFMIEENDVIIALPDSWPAAIGYVPWIEEVWVNYLSNGIKYGGRPDQGIAPQLSLGAEIVTPLTADDEPRVRFWLRDNGPGLTIDETQKIFTPFERLHNVRTEGHGLGLSIVQRIVEKLDGEVDVDSTLGSGSTFSFTLPGFSTKKMIVY